MTYLALIFASYLLGCLSSIVILIGLYLRYGLYPPGTVVKPEQHQAFRPIKENHHSKNTTVDTVNYILQFLFQELKDTSKLRRYVLKKLNREIDELKQTKVGRLVLEDIAIESFSLGKECPVFSDIQLERQERDQRKLIKEVGARLNFDYKDGFAATLDIKLKFGYKCQLYIKVKHIRGQLRLEFHREPYSHWLAVFQDEPTIDFELKSYFAARESPQLAQIILQQIRRVIRRKQTWPSYKIRYEPFFSRSRNYEQLGGSFIERRLLPGLFEIALISCDRLSIPSALFSRRNCSLSITISINERSCEENLAVHREQWTRKTLAFTPKTHHISIKEVPYMNRTEVLLEGFETPPNDIQSSPELQAELADQRVFVLQIGGKEARTIKQIQHFLHENNDKEVRVQVGVPLLTYIAVQPEVHPDDDDAQLSHGKSSSAERIPLMMMHRGLFHRFQMEEVVIKEWETFIKFHPKPEKRFQVGENQHFLNLCLWSDPPSHCTLPNIEQKRVLLGYASVTLSEIVLDAHMSFHHETQITLNLQSVCFDSRLFSKETTDLSTHLGFDANLTHGFVTVNIKHQPDLANLDDAKDRHSLSETEDMEEFTDVTDEPDLSPSKPTDHQFVGQHFQLKKSCGYCQKKIWPKSGAQCVNCSICVHKRCAEKLNQEHKCTQQPDLSSIEDENAPEEKTNKPVPRSKIAHVVSSAYSKFRERKAKRTSTTENRKAFDLNIPETDLHDIITRCLCEEEVDIPALDEIFREKALTLTEVYTKAPQFAHELFKDFTPEQRRMKIEAEVRALASALLSSNRPSPLSPPPARSTG